ncbi:hypothetical protein B0H10DRAFT_1966874 [Mycena sp. CBHHK59/15]|nr:hypothetical protein B0H10DRAFT_1966874 [Mycena sp. CBHHK59/15]
MGDQRSRSARLRAKRTANEAAATPKADQDPPSGPVSGSRSGADDTDPAYTPGQEPQEPDSGSEMSAKALKRCRARSIETVADSDSDSPPKKKAPKKVKKAQEAVLDPDRSA